MGKQLLAAIDDNRLQAVARGWLECRKGYPLPHWRNMPRALLEPLMPAVLLLRYAPARRSFRIEQVGPIRRRPIHGPVESEALENLLPADMVAEVRRDLLSIVEAPAALVIKMGDRDAGCGGAAEERLLLPMRGNDDETALILALAAPPRVSFRACSGPGQRSRLRDRPTAHGTRRSS
jgi:hypothetical protein